MKLTIHMDSNETYTNIGFAKAMTEADLSLESLKEISEYLLVYTAYHLKLKEDAE